MSNCRNLSNYFKLFYGKNYALQVKGRKKSFKQLQGHFENCSNTLYY